MGRSVRPEEDPSRRWRLAGYGLLALAGLVSMAASPAPSLAPTPTKPGTVLEAAVEGVIDNVVAGYVEQSVRKAEQDGAPALVIRLNTPGGSLDSTQRIVSALLDAKVPTIVWVAPSGGRAASAGTFITLAAHVALMAPGTNIGAASPVGSNGEDIPGTLGQKVKNDAIANITSIAQVRHRNVDWAVSAVESARSSPAAEAVSLGVVDGLARSIDEVLATATGRTVDVAGAPVQLQLIDDPVADLPINPFQNLLHLLSDPNIAAVLFSIGSLGLLYELASPNFVTGILGALALILSFIGFGSLPVNVGGLLLMGLAVVLFALELTVVSHGLLTVGGIVCFVLGASALYTAPGDPFAPGVAVATPFIVVAATTIAVFMAIIVITAVRSRGMRAPAAVTIAVSPGTEGVVRSPLQPRGSIYAAGEEWSARVASDEVLPRGTHVRVVGLDGLTVIVEPVATPSQS